MASLMENLFEILSEEKRIYEMLIPISEKKTEILVKGDLAELESITRQEQELVDKVYALGNRREEIIVNIGVVLNKDSDRLDLASLAGMLEKQPEEQKRLAGLHDSLKAIMKRLVEINEKNKELIENSLEMVEFNMNFIQSTRMSPGVNNYDRNAASSYTSGYGRGAFDAKQ